MDRQRTSCCGIWAAAGPVQDARHEAAAVPGLPEFKSEHGGGTAPSAMSAWTSRNESDGEDWAEPGHGPMRLMLLADRRQAATWRFMGIGPGRTNRDEKEGAASRPATTRIVTAGFNVHGLCGLLKSRTRSRARADRECRAAAARARGRKGGRPPVPMASVLQAAELMKNPNASPRAIAEAVGISRSTLYRYVSSDGELRDEAKAMLDRRTTGGRCRRR